MTSFIQPSFPTEHPGVVRIESAAAALGEMRRGFNSTKGLSTMLLAAMVSALVVVADQLIDTWADGHLLAAWVALWLVGFTAVAVFAGSARRLAATVVGSLDAWSQRVAKTRADERLWAIAQTDPRVMADLTAAMTRNQP
ncbi:hypothetical protein [Rhodoferax ferrireducens]|uniref:hypothetical protein n=1 Tax=Rhodoferax ferrireducens TaxID=192843 RepID=UPI000E0DFD61|nr:hypothetical protein [Rhodoferax ferrireducens]